MVVHSTDHYSGVVPDSQVPGTISGGGGDDLIKDVKREANSLSRGTKQ